ncbi:MAG: hypothetical protein M3024_12475 [Candidatus Dormibacteraeota bacterium]|nr:hypothetical protein [Candidatus Dormibacteraeota bacterium]
MAREVELEDLELSYLESVWEGGMGDAYRFYRATTAAGPALAAALVEAAADLHQLGGAAVEPGRVLLGDLCLARASRLLAATGDQRLQVGFARAVERVSAASAGGHPAPPLRDDLGCLLRSDG